MAELVLDLNEVLGIVLRHLQGERGGQVVGNERDDEKESQDGRDGGHLTAATPPTELSSGEVSTTARGVVGRGIRSLDRVPRRARVPPADSPPNDSHGNSNPLCAIRSTVRPPLARAGRPGRLLDHSFSGLSNDSSRRLNSGAARTGWRHGVSEISDMHPICRYAATEASAAGLDAWVRSFESQSPTLGGRTSSVRG
jgi:hypothetical protein